jgi:hypothetical protein
MWTRHNKSGVAEEVRKVKENESWRGLQGVFVECGSRASI